MHDVSQIGTRSRADGPLLSSFAIGSAVASLEIVLIVVGSALGGATYEALTESRGDVLSTINLGCLAGLIYTYFAQRTGLYRLSVIVHPLSHLRRIAKTCVFALVTLTAVLFILKISTDFSRGAVLIFALFVMLLCVLSRFGVGHFVGGLLDRDRITGRRVVVVGDDDELARLQASTLLADYGLQEVARMPIDLAKAEEPVWQDTFRDVLHLSRLSKAREFLVVSAWTDLDSLARIEQAVRRSPLRVRLLPNHVYRAAMARQLSNDDIAARLVELQRAPLSLTEQLAKRACDLVIASAALIVLSPLLLMTAVAIKLDSPGSVIFRQRRNGFNQLRFVIYKFRSMRVIEDGATVVQAQRGDSRVTRVGRFLRRSSIDELPQLFNVLKGDMSLVGPRPHALAHDDAYTELIDDYCLRHHVKPGITGWAQVNGFRGETARTEQMKRRVELDVWYVNNQSMLLDLRIMLKTCVELMSHDAY